MTTKTAEFNNVTKVYKNNEGIQKLSFILNSGECVGLLGLNGAGKTTTLKLLAGLLQPTSGRIDVLGSTPRCQRSNVVFVSENDDLYSWMEQKDCIKFMNSFYQDFSEEKFIELSKLLDLQPRKAQELSKGERGRLRLAMAFSRSAKIFLLDEPLSGIDIISREKIIKTLLSALKSDITILLSTHEVEEADDLFTRSLFLKKGQIIREASSSQLKSEGKTFSQAFREYMQ